MNATKVTQKDVLKFAREKYGKKVEVEYHPKAPGKEEKEQARARLAEIKPRLEYIKEQRNQEQSSWKTLLAKAEFVCDVDGDDPSIPELQTAVELVKLMVAFKEEWKELDTEQSLLRTQILRARCEVLVHKGWCREVVAREDTWEEVMEKLGGKP